MKKIFLILLMLCFTVNSTVYRVNGNGGRGYAITQTGGVGNELKGSFGFQKAVSLAVAGDTIRVAAPYDTSLQMDRLVKITIPDMTSSWQKGDSVQNNTGTGNHWTAVLCSLTTTTASIELRTGTYATVTTSEGVTNVTRSSNTTISAKECPGIVSITTDGTYANMISIIGYDATFSQKTLAILNGNDQSAYGITITGTDYWRFEYLYFYQMVNDGLYAVTTASTGIEVNNCKSTDNGRHGYNIGVATNVTMFKCVATLNAQQGFNVGVCTLLFPKAISNGREGVNIGDRCLVLYGILAKNTRSNINVQGGVGVRIIGNVIHGVGTGYSNILIGANYCTVLGNRITSSNQYGISSAGSIYMHFEDYNYFQGNTLGNLSGVNAEEHSVTGTDTNFGYTDYANDNYVLSPTATNKSVPIDLNW